MANRTTQRSVTYRLMPGTPEKARALSRVAGACRYVWNQVLADQEDLYRIARMHGAKAPSVSFFTLSQAFKDLRSATPWLQELPARVVRYTLKRQADTWDAFFAGKGRRPQFKARRADDGFTIPFAVRVEGCRLRIPTVGWVTLRRRGGNPYQDGKPKQVYVTHRCGKWYATVAYEVTLAEPADNGLAVGVDMNVGQVAVSTGDILRMPDMAVLEARRKRYQRMVSRRQKGSNRRERAKLLLARTNRRIANARRNWHHHVGRTLADTAGLVCVEDLRVKAMTAKGTRGLNRAILATGWGQLRSMIDYKATNAVAVNPAYTSQTCAECGHVERDNRVTQARFECVSCGHRDNADINAARNIMASGIGATGRRGALALATPANRQIGRKAA